MDVEVSKENLCINKLIVQKKELIFVHNDMIVPDTKPDILNTINATGNVCIYKKEVLDDKIKIDGSVNTYVMYLPDSKDDNLRALNCNLEFSENIQVPNAREGMTLFIKPCIKDIECKVLNGRKISIKVGIEFDIRIYSNEDISIINKINNIEDIQILPQEFTTNSLSGSGKTTVYAKETLNLDSEDEFAEILRLDIGLVNADLKISYNKVLAKSDLEIKIMYLTEDNKVKKVIGNIPVVGFIDIQNITEENMCDVNYSIKNMEIKPNQASEHSIYVEFEIEVTVMAFEKKQINLIQDLYSPTLNLEFTQKRIASNCDRNEKEMNLTIKEQVKVQSLEEQNLIDVEIKPNILNTQTTMTKINYSGELSLNFIFKEENTLMSRTVNIPFETSIENELKTDKINIETEMRVLNSEFKVNTLGEVDAKIDILINTKISKNITMNIIDNIEIVENEINNEDYDSLIIYIVKSGDSLWNIAKNYNSTVEDLVRMNGIENPNKLNIGQKIYIPKFKFIKREQVS